MKDNEPRSFSGAQHTLRMGFPPSGNVTIFKERVMVDWNCFINKLLIHSNSDFS